VLTKFNWKVANVFSEFPEKLILFILLFDGEIFKESGGHDKFTVKHLPLGLHLLKELGRGGSSFRVSFHKLLVELVQIVRNLALGFYFFN